MKAVDTQSPATQKTWIYWSKLYQSKFQAGCLVKRMEEDWWLMGYASPSKIEIFQTKKGYYGVRYKW